MTIKNGDLPAMPVHRSDDEGNLTVTQQYISGLTKREMFAMAAMQGILGNTYGNEHGYFDDVSVSKSAVNYADALLAELERTK